MKKILLIHRHNIDPDGSGGHHRIYQIYQDLVSEFGNTDIDTLLIVQREKPPTTKKYYTNLLLQRIRLFLNVVRYGANPDRLLQKLLDGEIQKNYPFGKIGIDDYIKYIRRKGKPDVCLIDYPNFIDIAKINITNKIPTIYYPHNLESFDRYYINGNNNSRMIKMVQYWAKELYALSICDEIIAISRLENEFLNSIGLNSYYYPYLPVGDIRKRLVRVREDRINNSIDHKLFLLLGSVTHATTREGFKWFLNAINKQGLPHGIRIVVVGRGSDLLAHEYDVNPGIEFKGRISTDELNDLLIKVGGVLIPQHFGFGAITRIPEMSCAGIPIIVSKHPLAAYEEPPGLVVVDKTWDSWEKAITSISIGYSPSTNFHEYEYWEKNQPNPLKMIISTYL